MYFRPKFTLIFGLKLKMIIQKLKNTSFFWKTHILYNTHLFGTL